MPGNEFPLRGQSPDWLASLDPASQAEWRSLARESDPELYQEGLLSFAACQERRNHEAVAGAIYGSMLDGREGSEASTFQRAQERLAVLNGGGNTGTRAEYLLRHLTREISDPTTIVAMGTAAAIFRMTRLATLARLHSAAPSLVTRGWGAGRLASLAGFALEAPAFTFSHRLSRAALGHSQDWNFPALAHELAGSYLMLGAMKLGAGGASSLQGLGGYRGPVANALFQQSGMLGGILVSQALERRLGWRPNSSTDGALADVMATWLQFNIAGRLSQGVLGSRFQGWERSMEARSIALERTPLNPPLAPLFQRGVRNILSAIPPFEKGGLGGIFPRPALAGTAAEHGRSPQTEGLRANVMMMSNTKFGETFEAPTRGLAPEPVTEPARPSESSDPRQALLRVEIPRVIRSRDDQDYSYRLLLEDFKTFLEPGADRPIALRDGREIRLRLVDRENTREGNLFLPAGLQGYRYEIREGETKGDWLLYDQADGIMSFSLTTDQMRPGVGGIVLDWMASQAAATRRQAQFAVIHNVGVFDIIRRRGLIDEGSSIIEAHKWTPRRPRQSIPLGFLGNPSFIYNNRGGYFNLWAHPRKTLVPSELRFAVIDRNAGPNAAHPYELLIQPLREFLSPGHTAIIARREGRNVEARVSESVLTGVGDRFMPAGTPRLALQIREGEAVGGKIDVYVEPHRLTVANVERGELPPGSGTILLDWIYSQAAARGAAVDLLNIKNPHIWEILRRQGFFNPKNARLELGHWDWMMGEFQPMASGTYEGLDPMAHYRFNELMMEPVIHLRSQPNPSRLPPDLRPPAAE